MPVQPSPSTSLLICASLSSRTCSSGACSSYQPLQALSALEVGKIRLGRGFPGLKQSPRRP